jgi:hypothetical protein
VNNLSAEDRTIVTHDKYILIGDTFYIATATLIMAQEKKSVVIKMMIDALFFDTVNVLGKGHVKNSVPAANKFLAERALEIVQKLIKQRKMPPVIYVTDKGTELTDSAPGQGIAVNMEGLCIGHLISRGFAALPSLKKFTVGQLSINSPENAKKALEAYTSYATMNERAVFAAHLDFHFKMLSKMFRHLPCTNSLYVIER